MNKMLERIRGWISKTPGGNIQGDSGGEDTRNNLGKNPASVNNGGSGSGKEKKIELLRLLESEPNYALQEDGSFKRFDGMILDPGRPGKLLMTIGQDRWLRYLSPEIVQVYKPTKKAADALWQRVGYPTREIFPDQVKAIRAYLNRYPPSERVAEAEALMNFLVPGFRNSRNPEKWVSGGYADLMAIAKDEAIPHEYKLPKGVTPYALAGTPGAEKKRDVPGRTSAQGKNVSSESVKERKVEILRLLEKEPKYTLQNDGSFRRADGSVLDTRHAGDFVARFKEDRWMPGRISPETARAFDYVENVVDILRHRVGQQREIYADQVKGLRSFLERYPAAERVSEAEALWNFVKPDYTSKRWPEKWMTDAHQELLAIAKGETLNEEHARGIRR